MNGDGEWSEGYAHVTGPSVVFVRHDDGSRVIASFEDSRVTIETKDGCNCGACVEQRRRDEAEAKAASPGGVR